MRLVDEFYMNFDTILFCPKYDDYGNLYTCILENNALFSHKMAPTDLIDENLKYYGTSLAGATAGAKMILKGVFMPPIVISKGHGLYWFPSKSPSRKDCVWFALHHIKSYCKIGKKKTCVTFNNGSTFDVNISAYSFSSRIKHAYLLKGAVERRMQEIPSRVAEKSTAYHFNESDRGINYRIKSSN